MRQRERKGEGRSVIRKENRPSISKGRGSKEVRQATGSGAELSPVMKMHISKRAGI